MADYTGVNRAERRFGAGKNVSSFQESPPNAQEDGTKETPKQRVIRTRIHPALAQRHTQIEVNLLGLEGGSRYVAARLSRFPGEPAITFEGGSARDGRHITGRLQQSHVIPYLQRIADKIDQYVVNPDIQREGIDPAFAADVTRGGQGINRFWADVSSTLTAAGWCWVGVDAPAISGVVSEADRERLKLRPYWQLFSPLEVVDWSFKADGTLEWLLTEVVWHGSPDAFTPWSRRLVRKLWQDDAITKFWFNKSGTHIEGEETVPNPFGFVPFVPVGTISDKPIIFDSLESVQRTIMDLNSVSRQNYFEGVFPARYFPASMRQTFIDGAQGNAGPEGFMMAIGEHYPIFVESDESPPGVINTNALVSFEPCRREINVLVQELFNTVGLMLRKDMAAAESGIAKAFDFLDVDAALRFRAQQLQEAEEKVVAVTGQIDPSFAMYEPKYPMTFNARDFVEEIKALVLVGNMPLPMEVTKGLQRKLIDALDGLGMKFTADQRKKMEAAIEEQVDEFVPDPLPPIGNTAGLAGE